jgi:CBS-domain-containing membrane protein
MPKQQGRRRDRQLFGIERVLGPEAAADIGRDDANALFRQAQPRASTRTRLVLCGICVLSQTVSNSSVAS